MVRDATPELIKADGRICSYHAASEREYQKKLLQKFYEDVRGVLNATQWKDKKEKLAELHDTCEALMLHYGFTMEEIVYIRQEKKEKF
ncbi:MAG: nucleoside triphosphate pyrophosphohydrolase [Candidatus Peribacteria bacterium]|nr:nucleoside triphosphate pyrophosphohydrolase [Candidatus Peribacteria bacterium]